MGKKTNSSSTAPLRLISLANVFISGLAHLRWAESSSLHCSTGNCRRFDLQTCNRGMALWRWAEVPTSTAPCAWSPWQTDYSIIRLACAELRGPTRPYSAAPQAKSLILDRGMAHRRWAGSSNSSLLPCTTNYCLPEVCLYNSNWFYTHKKHLYVHPSTRLNWSSKKENL